MDYFHKPVLLEETIEGLRVRKNGRYIDGTIGGGGHTQKILEEGGIVLGIDQDIEAIEHLKKKFESEEAKGQIKLVNGNFADIENIAQANDFSPVDGILLDLGVSSFQIDQSGRGFTFRNTEPLNMRMDNRNSLTAYEIVNKYTEEELRVIFAKYGEIPEADEVAHAIVERRKTGEIKLNSELSQAIEQVIKPNGKTNPSTRVFQAIRIAVNDEIENLKKGLDAGFKLLDKGGRMEIISFHSLEDRITKLFFLKLVQTGQARIVNKKPIVASENETVQNRRARSAKLRIIEKI